MLHWRCSICNNDKYLYLNKDLIVCSNCEQVYDVKTVFRQGKFRKIFAGLLILCFLSVFSYGTYRYIENKKKSELPKYYPDYIIFFNQKIDVNWTIKYYIDFFSKDRLLRKKIMKFYHHSGLYEKMVESVINSENFYQDLFYVAIQESGFNPKITSPKHARGIWQFIPETGKRLGLRQIPKLDYDERSDPMKSTQAAIRYLKYLNYSSRYNFNDWFLSLAAYNIGPSSLQRYIRINKTSNYWELYNFPFETKRYIPQIAAIKTIFENPKLYGFPENKKYEPLDLDRSIIKLKYHIALWQIAKWTNEPLQKIKKYNPHITNFVPVSIPVNIYVPSGDKNSFLAKLQEFENYKDNLNQIVSYYVTGKYDTLKSIAKRFRVKYNEIYVWNKRLHRWVNSSKYTNRLKSGQRIKIQRSS